MPDVPPEDTPAKTPRIGRADVRSWGPINGYQATEVRLFNGRKIMIPVAFMDFHKWMMTGPHTAAKQEARARLDADKPKRARRRKAKDDETIVAREPDAKGAPEPKG